MACGAHGAGIKLGGEVIEINQVFTQLPDGLPCGPCRFAIAQITGNLAESALILGLWAMICLINPKAIIHQAPISKHGIQGAKLFGFRDMRDALLKAWWGVIHLNKALNVNICRRPHPRNHNSQKAKLLQNRIMRDSSNLWRVKAFNTGLHFAFGRAWACLWQHIGTKNLKQLRILRVSE